MAGNCGYAGNSAAVSRRGYQPCFLVTLERENLMGCLQGDCSFSVFCCSLFLRCSFPMAAISAEKRKSDSFAVPVFPAGKTRVAGPELCDQRQIGAVAGR